MSDVEMYRSHVEKAMFSSRNSFVKNTSIGVTVFRREETATSAARSGALGSEMHISSHSSVKGCERADKRK